MAKNKLPSDSNSRRSKAEQNIVELPGHEQSALVGDISSYVEAISKDINSALVTVVTGKYSNIKEGNLKTKMTQKNIFLGMYGILNTEIKNTIKDNNSELKKISTLLGTEKNGTILDYLSFLVSYLTSTSIKKDEGNQKINGILSLDISNPEGLEAWNEFIHSFEDTKEIDKYIENLDNVEKLFSKVEKTFSSESSATKSIETVVGFGNLSKKTKDSLNDLKDVFSIFEKLSKTKFSKEDIEKIKEIIDSMTEVLDTSVSNLIKASEKNESSMSTLKRSFEETYKIAISGVEIDRRKLIKSKASLGEIISAITVMGLVMLIGGYIIEKNPDLIRGSIIFGVTFATFLMTLMIPIALLSVIDFSSSKESMKGLSTFIIISSMIMMIGGYFMKDKNFAKDSILFGATLSAFLLLITFPIIILASIDVGGKVSSNLKALKSFILTSAIIMTIGALFIASDNGSFVKNALRFGLVLSAFIGLTILPIFIISAIVPKAIPILKEITQFVVLSSIVLMIGAAVMKKSELVKAAFNFAFALSAFVGMLLTEILVYSYLIRKADKVLDEVSDFILTSAAVMVIGALIVKNRSMVENAILFGVVLSTFISITLLPILLFTVLVRKAARTLEDIMGFIIVANAMLVLGSYIIENRPDIVNSGLLFGVVLGLFISSILLPFLLLNKIMMEKATVGLLFIGGFILLAAASLYIAGYTYNEFGVEAIKGAGLLLGFILVVGAILYLVKSISKVAKEASIGAAVMAFALIEVAVAIYIINNVIPDLNKELLLKIALCTGIVIALGIVLALISINGANAIKAAVAMAGMCIVFVLFGLTVSIIDAIIPEDTSVLKNKLIFMGIIVGAVAVVLTLMSLVMGNVLLAAAAMALSAITFGLFAFVITIIDRIIPDDGEKLKSKIENLGIIMGNILGLFFLVGIGSGVIILGTIAALLASVAIKLITDDIEYIIEAEEKAKTININEGSLNIKNVFDAFFKTLDSITLNPIKIAKYLIKAAVLTKIVFSIALPLAIIGKTVSYLAGLRIPVAWNSDGKPIDFVNINDEQFGSAKENIKSIITTLFEGISSATNKIKDYSFKDLFKTITLTSSFGIILSSLAHGIQSFANLKVPTDWDRNGRPIKFEKFTDTTFKNARTNISDVITTLFGAVNDVYEKNPSLFADLNGISSEGFLKFKINRAKSPAIQVLKAASMLGDIIGSISSGLQLYANLKVPTSWDNYGRPTGFVKFGSEQIKTASQTISTVISTMLKTVIGIYNEGNNKELFDEVNTISSEGLFKFSKRKSSSPISSVLSASITLAQMINGLATGIQAFALLKYPTAWDENGNPIAFKNMGEGEFTQAAENIKKVITCTTEAVIATVEQDTTGIFKNRRKSKKIMEAISPIGTLISSLAEGIEKISNLIIPIAWDSNGKPTAYKKLENTDFVLASNNIKTVITTIAEAVSTAYTESIKKVGIRKFIKIIEAYKPLNEFISSFANNMVNYATGKFKISDTETVTLNESDFKKAGSNIMGMVTSITDTLIRYYKENSLFFDSNNNGSLVYLINKFEEVNNLISKIVETVSKTSNIKEINISAVLESGFKSINSIYSNKEYVDLIENKEKINKLDLFIDSVVSMVSKNIELFNNIGAQNTIKLRLAKENISIMVSSIFESIGKSDDALESKLVTINNLTDKITSFNTIMNLLIESGYNTSTINTQPMVEFSNKIGEFSENSNKLNTKPLENFVSITNSVNIQKVSKLTGLMEAMSKLADKMGGFDKLADALDEDFINVLNTLGSKVDAAKATIEAAEKIEKERQEKFNKNLEKISNIMKESISIKVGSLDEDGNINAGYEKEK